MKFLIAPVALSMFLVACSSGGGGSSESSDAPSPAPVDDAAEEVADRAAEEGFPFDEELPEDDDFERIPSLLLGYSDAQATSVILTINQRLFSGMLQDEEQNCIETDPAVGEPVLEAVCNPGYPILDGLLSEASFISFDAEQGREDNNADCRADLINGISNECQTSVVELSYTPLELSYSYSFNGRDDPNVTVTPDSNSLSCSISYEFGVFDGQDAACDEIVGAFADSIEQRMSASTLAALSLRGQRLIQVARTNARRQTDR